MNSKKDKFKKDIAILVGYYPNIYKDLDDLINEEIECYNADLFKMIKSESVGKLLRFGVKNPTYSGMDDCNDNLYYDLYDYRAELIKSEEL